ncbi:MAG: hypothetical protein ABIR57_06555 [Aeromicrobium sp.]
MIQVFSKPVRIAVVAAIAAICLTATGCGVVDAGTSDAIHCIPPKGVQTIEEYTNQVCEERPEPLPAPSLVQQNEIISKLQRFGQKPGTMVDRSDGAIMSVCVSLLGGASAVEIAPHAAKWFSRGKDRLSVAQSRSIVDLIETQGWCLM